MKYKSKEVPKCSRHKDCFANKEGRCIALKETDFEEKDCPFYKSEDVVSRDQIEADIKAYAEAHGGSES